MMLIVNICYWKNQFKHGSDVFVPAIFIWKMLLVACSKIIYESWWIAKTSPKNSLCRYKTNLDACVLHELKEKNVFPFAKL